MWQRNGVIGALRATSREVLSCLEHALITGAENHGQCFGEKIISPNGREKRGARDKSAFLARLARNGPGHGAAAHPGKRTGQQQQSTDGDGNPQAANAAEAAVVCPDQRARRQMDHVPTKVQHRVESLQHIHAEMSGKAAALCRLFPRRAAECRAASARPSSTQAASPLRCARCPRRRPAFRSRPTAASSRRHHFSRRKRDPGRH